MGEEIFVVEALTSGPYGYPYDEIIDIGICAVDVEAGTYRSVYHNVVFKDPKDLGKDALDYLSKYGLFAEEIYAGDPEDKVAKEVLAIIRGNSVTSYDVKNEFGRYMVCHPWDVTYETTILSSVSARQPISLRCKDPADEPEIIRKAYRRTFKDDPANVGKGRRALHLALMTSELLLELRSRGKY